MSYEPKYFKWSEFNSGCPSLMGGKVEGSGRAGMDPDFVYLLDVLRERFKKPIVISSGFRFPEYNAKVSSTGLTGAHTTGKAVDIRVSGEDAHELLKIANDMEVFTGIGISQKGKHASRFIHLDTLKPKEAKGLRPWLWSY